MVEISRLRKSERILNPKKSLYLKAVGDFKQRKSNPSSFVERTQKTYKFLYDMKKEVIAHLMDEEDNVHDKKIYNRTASKSDFSKRSSEEQDFIPLQIERDRLNKLIR